MDDYNLLKIDHSCHSQKEFINSALLEGLILSAILQNLPNKNLPHSLMICFSSLPLKENLSCYFARAQPPFAQNSLVDCLYFYVVMLF